MTKKKVSKKKKVTKKKVIKPKAFASCAQRERWEKEHPQE